MIKNGFIETSHLIDSFSMFGHLYKNIYRGNWKYDKPNGFGIQYKYNDTYIGSMKNGKKHGYGIFKSDLKGYKDVSASGYSWYQRGIHFGYFYKNKFKEGKVIEFNRTNNEKNVYFVKNFKLNGEYRIFNSSQTFLFTYVNNQLIGKYEYNGEYYIDANLWYGEFHGPFRVWLKEHNCYHYLYYDFGKIQQNSLFVLKNGFYFLLEWYNNICYEIIRMGDKHNRFYFPLYLFQKLNYTTPSEFECPIGYTYMIQPYINEFNQVYEFKNIRRWIHGDKKKINLRDPLTNQIMNIERISPHHVLQYKALYNLYELFFVSKEYTIK